MARGNRITGIRRIVLALVGPRKILEDGRNRSEVVRVYPPQLSQNVITGGLCICLECSTMVEKSGMQIVERSLLAAEQTYGDEDLTASHRLYFSIDKRSVSMVCRCA